MRRALSAILLSLALLAAAGCGGDDEELVLGGETATERGEIQQQLRSLRRRVGRLKRRRSRKAPRREPASEQGIPLGAADARSISDLAARLGSEVGLTVGLPGAPASEQLGTLVRGSAWSTIKVPIAAAVLAGTDGPAGASAEQRGLIESALTASDNAAAAALWEQLAAAAGGVEGAAGATTAALRAAGDPTRVSTVGRDGFSPYGQTDWALADQHRFMSSLAAGCEPSPDIAEYLLDQLGQVVPSQRWGLGSAGVPARFKGGWGPDLGGGYLVRQMGVLELAPERPLVVTLAARPHDGQFTTGTHVLTELAAWLVANVDAPRTPTPDCL